MCNACQTCQKLKILGHTKSAIHQIELPTIHFNTVHLDIIGPLPVTWRHYETYSTLYRYVLSCINCASGSKLKPLQDITAQSVANVFIHAWIEYWVFHFT